MSQPPSQQTPDPRILLDHFLRQVQSHHVKTPSRTPLPLHYDFGKEMLQEWPWCVRSPDSKVVDGVADNADSGRPCDPDTKARVAPSNLESYRRTHRFRGPCCLCALLDRTEYTEARIGVVETASEDSETGSPALHGEYVATCPAQRCGYLLCLERFYPLNGLKLKICQKRALPLPLQELNRICLVEKSYGAGGGLLQLMHGSTRRGRDRLRALRSAPEQVRQSMVRDLSTGISEERFWSTFTQCITCKVVMFRGSMMHHACEVPKVRSTCRATKKHRPYAQPIVYARLEAMHGDAPDTPRLSPLTPPDVPTDIGVEMGGGPADEDTSRGGMEVAMPGTQINGLNDGSQPHPPDRTSSVTVRISSRSFPQDRAEVIPGSRDEIALSSDEDKLPSILDILKSSRRRVRQRE
ncbi:hypothetical protein NMY22_g11844 [Coprinellus aureogranulatus]|nr:hypothetical protein NMY22_g11844 [Coprinellus aureogranulatus]